MATRFLLFPWQLLFAEREMVFYVNKMPRILVRDLLGELIRVLNLEQRESGKESVRVIKNLRLVEVSQHRIANVIDDDTTSDIIMNNNTVNRYYRAEEVPDEELEIGPGEVLAPVAHFHKEARSTFGIPFLIKVRIIPLRKHLFRKHWKHSFSETNSSNILQITIGEKWTVIRSRLQSRVSMSEKEWSKIRIAIVQQGTPTFLEENETDSVARTEQFQSYTATYNGRPWIGIEHVNKAPKRSRYSTLEKAIKIYN
jgi:ubiquitin carboxyl-terminal hydrolase 7